MAPHVFRFRAVQKSASLRPLRGGVEAGAKGWQCRPGGARDPALSSADFIMEKFDAGAHMARYTANTDPSGFAVRRVVLSRPGTNRPRSRSISSTHRPVMSCHVGRKCRSRSASSGTHSGDPDASHARSYLGAGPGPPGAPAGGARRAPAPPRFDSAHSGWTPLHGSGSVKRSTQEPLSHWYHRLSNLLWTHALSGISLLSVPEKQLAPRLPNALSA